MNCFEGVLMKRFHAAPEPRGRGEYGAASRMPWVPPDLWRYGVATSFVGAALGVKLLLDPFIREESPFLLFLGAVMVATLVGGLGAGLFATMLAALVADYLFMSPFYSLRVDGFGEGLRLSLFVVEGSLIGVLVSKLRRARWRANRDRSNLRRSEERFRATFEQAAVGVAHVDTEGRWLRVNDRLCGILGYTRQEMLRLSFQDVTHPDDLDADLDRARRLLAGEIETYSTEMRYLRKDGTVVWAGLTVSLVREHGPDEGYFISVVEDISGRKQAEEALRKTEQRLRQAREQERLRISRDLHDEVLSDLVYALQEAQIVRAINRGGRNAPPEEIEPRLNETVGTLRRSVEGLRRVIFDLRLENIELSLAHSLESLVELNRRMSRGRFGVELRIEDEAAAALPAGPAMDLIRIVQEALNNARRHSGASRVRVRVAVEENGVLLAEVADDGRGFDPDECRKGGVGLSSKRERARKLGGQIDIRSEPGEGTVVSLRAPLERLRDREEGTGG